MRLIQINSVCNSGSTGRIAEEVGKLVMSQGGTSCIAYGRGKATSQSIQMKIGGRYDTYRHILATRLKDNHGFSSKHATRQFVTQMRQYKPDIVHLHNIHGYYINIEILFKALQIMRVPIVWTLHDCWSFTGHCSHFESIGCKKWLDQCYECPQKNAYPSSLGIDRSFKNYQDKKRIFSSVKDKLTLVPVSNWLEDLLSKSFFKETAQLTIKNGVDLSIFKPNQSFLHSQTFTQNIKHHYLSVSNKGLDDVISFSSLLDEDEVILIVGLSEKEAKKASKIPKIQVLPRVSSQKEMSALYGKCSAYLNFTYGDTYPTTNLESIASGTPVVTYKTGGSPESVSKTTGFVVDQNDFLAVRRALNYIKKTGKEKYSRQCREYAEANFDKNICFEKYLKLYEEIM